MAIKVYWGSGSMPAWRVLLGLRHKGVPYEGHMVSFSARETRTPEFLAINPRGKVPTLVHDDLVLSESLAILAWLEARFPSPALFGQSPAEVGQVWRRVMEYESHGSPAFSAVARPILLQGADASTLAEARPAVEDELDRLHAAVGGAAGDPLVGDRLSAADLVWYAGLRFLERAACRPAGAALGLAPFGARWPGLLPWAARVEAIPGFEETFPPHWRAGEHASALQLR